MKIYQTTKSVLAVKNNAVSFLNGLTSNDMTAPRNAFLTVHGRIIATFDQRVLNPDEVWIVLEKDFVQPVLVHLDRYARLSRASLAELPLKVYFDLTGECGLHETEVAIPQWHGQLIVSPLAKVVNVEEAEFTAFRLQYQIPQQGIDYKDEFLLNVSQTEFVSYTKGCFLGQEPVAKVYHRSKPTWRLVVKNEQECTVEEQLKMTSRSFDPARQIWQGFVFVPHG